MDDVRKQLALMAKRHEDDAVIYDDLDAKYVREGGTRLKTADVATAHRKAAEALWALALGKDE